MKAPEHPPRRWRAAVLAVVLATVAGCSEHPAGGNVIRAVSLMPSQTHYSRDFLDWIDEVNARTDGKFHIVYVGGPEAVPTFEQADAARTGVVHMVFGPGTYYMGQLPEIEALFASNVPPWETRRNGGVALMDRLHRERLGVRYLGRASYVEQHLFTRDRPPLDADGLPDLRELKLRGGPVWRDFIKALGAVFVNMAAADTYTALERGTIDGLGWTIIGLEDFSWDEHLGYRIDPGVFSSDLGIIMNEDKWAALSDAARTLLEDAIIEYETASYRRFKALTRKSDARMRERGMNAVELEPGAAARYEALAHSVIWDRIAERAPGHYEALRDHFYREVR